MKNHTSVVALAIIILAAVSCSKKSADTTITQQKASGVQVVTNDGRFVYTLKSITNSTPATNGLRRGKKIVIKDNTVTEIPAP